MKHNHCALALAALFALSAGTQAAFAETQSVIDPVEAPEVQKPPAPQAEQAPQPDPALKRERQRAKQEQRQRADAAARAATADNEAAKARAVQQAQRAKAAAAKEAARKAAAKEAAAKEAAQRAQAARLAKAKLAAQKEAARQEALRQAIARDAAAKEAATREVAAREAAVREATQREAAAREAVAKEAAAREQAVREAAAREAAAREAAAREAAAKEAAAREQAAREAREAARLAAREAESRAAAAQPYQRAAFRDCPECPEVVWLPKGEVSLGQPVSTAAPRYVTRVNYTLAVGRFKVSFAEWDACVADGGCRARADDVVAWDRVRQPVTNVSWEDAQRYVTWLSRKTAKHYRLLTGAEWEYAARAGSEVHDMQGSVSEWVENCYQYRDARTGGKAWTLECTNQVLRGGAQYAATATRVARSFAPFNYSDSRIGFRIARTD